MERRGHRMQGIDALGYEEVMTFLRSTPANLFFKDTECRYLFVSDSRTFFPYGEGKEEDVLGKTDLEIWSSEEQARFYYEQDQKVLATGKGTSFITEVPREDGIAYYQIKKNPVVLEGKIIGIVGLIGDITERVRLDTDGKSDPGGAFVCGTGTVQDHLRRAGAVKYHAFFRFCMPGRHFDGDSG